MTRRSALVSLTIPLAIVPLAALAISGCEPSAMASGGASVGIAVAQERSIGAAVDDTIIASQIVSNFYQFDIELLRLVSAEVVEGRVLLTGNVPNPVNRVDAVRVTWQVDGVTEVLNEIQVSNQTGLKDFALDLWISTQFRTKLLLDKDIRAINYNVETVNRVIYLIGIARSELELKRITNHARTIENVQKVISHVRILGAN
ncbi:MAG: BON domain-containing protein [Alphaproteobacteria bacterium]